ncbi:MAG: MFS transporter [Candidatus Latescibacterota bacterium]|nr:MAG: MFS transporter [Candidatus Latescibacterota bacterium]
MATSSIVKICFFSFTIAQFVSIFGDRLHQFSVVGMIGRVAPGSSIELFQFALFGHLPILVFAPFFGSLIDRANRAVVLVSVDALRGFIVLLIPLLYQLMGNMYAFYLPVFLLSLANLLFAPAKSAAIPEYFGSLKLLQINAALWGLGIVGTIGGFLLGGWFFDFMTWQLSFYCDGVSYLVSTLFLVPLFFLSSASIKKAARERPTATGERKQRFGAGALVRSIRDGIELIRTNRQVAYCLIAQASLFGILGILYIVGIGRVQEVLPPGKTIYLSAVATAGTVGLLAGSALATTTQGKISHNRVVAHSVILIAVALLALSRSQTLIPIMSWTFMLGVGVSPVTIVTETLLQMNIPESFRGRVFSAREVLTKSAFLVAALLATLLTIVLHKALIIFFIGVFLAVTGLLFERKDYLRV